MSDQLTELPAVAKTIHLPCKKCGVDRFFIVTAHTTPTSAKVKCEVCGASKTFKLTAPKKAKSKLTKTGAKRATRTKGPSPEEVWAQLRDKHSSSNVQPYTMKARFEHNAVIQHPKFGVGYVKTSTPEKIDVTFQEGERSLVHNRTT
jgi:hypothetical protein